MVLHYLWLVLFGGSVLVAGYDYFFLHQQDIFAQMVQAMFDAAQKSVSIAFGLVGMMTLFLGLMHIGEKAGAIQQLSRWVYPFFSKLFPKIKKEDPVMGEMMMNFSANLLGLDNAATPFGLKAMASLQKRNKSRTSASAEQIMFVALHSAGLTLIPLTVISQRVILGAAQPTAILIPIILATLLATAVIIAVLSLYQKIPLTHPVFWGSFLSLSALVLLLIFCVPKDKLLHHATTFGNVFILLLFLSFMLLAVRKKIDIYDTFIEGAKNGFKTAIYIIPYLVGMLVMIAVFRSSGAFTLLLQGITYLLSLLHLSGDYVAALPVALMKPFSGSGARALMLDTMQTYGADSFVGNLACIFQGSSDTTLYITALYFGSVGIKNVRYALKAALIADSISIILAIGVGYLFLH